MTPLMMTEMTPAELRASGEALFGYGWQSKLARHFSVADRTVRRWVAGEAPVPEGIATAIRDMMAMRPPGGSTAEQDRDAAAALALAPHLDRLATLAERAGWHPAEVVTATMEWAVSRSADGAGIPAAIETLRQALEALKAERDT